jgi:hypothetical protein
MLNFTQQTVINSSDRFEKSTSDILRIKRIGDYKKANIKSVFKTVASDPVKGTAVITHDALTPGSAYRLIVYLRLQKSVNSLYANDLVYKGKPLFFEFKGSDDVAKAINSQQRMWDNGITYLVASGTATTLTLTCADEYQLFYHVELQKFEPTAVNGDPTASQYTSVYKFVNGEAGNSAQIVVNQSRLGVGTYDMLIQDLRLPTYENTNWISMNKMEMPIVGEKYTQYVLEYEVERGIMGLGSAGALVTARTTHVFFVKSDLVAAFDGILNTIVNDVQVVSYPGATQELFIVGDTLIDLSANEKTQLEVEGANGAITWVSGTPETADVADGLVTPKAVGTTVITATDSKGNSGYITIEVVA